MVGVGSRIHQTLSAASLVDPNLGTNLNAIEFKSREDVESLLNERVKGKNKNDYKPYIVHTNVYIQCVGNREQQFYTWFDPTSDFHNYTMHWNPTQILWIVDGIPIRAFRNYEGIGIPYPNKQGMRVYSSIWNADNWATRGGLEKIDWNGASFIARYKLDN